MNKVPPVKFRIEQSASPVVMDQSEPSILPVENDLSKNGHSSSSPLKDESKPSKKRKLPNCENDTNNQKSPKNSTPPPVEPVVSQPVANNVQEPVKMVQWNFSPY